jgi:hypothetical protein
MSVLLASPFNYVFDDLVLVKATASNVAFSYGTASALNTAGAKVRIVPVQMAPVTVSSYNDLEISITWTALTSAADTSNSAILSYQLLWDNGNSGLADGSFIVIQEQLTLAYTATSITPGSSYRFKVKARNIYGLSTLPSADHTPTLIPAIDIPDKVKFPVITIDGSTPTSVLVTWEAPLDHGSAVDNYEV